MFLAGRLGLLPSDEVVFGPGNSASTDLSRARERAVGNPRIESATRDWSVVRKDLVFGKKAFKDSFGSACSGEDFFIHKTTFGGGTSSASAATRAR